MDLNDRAHLVSRAQDAFQHLISSVDEFGHEVVLKIEQAIGLAPPAADPRDAEIEGLKLALDEVHRSLHEAEGEIDELQTKLDAAEAEVKAADAQLGALKALAASPPAAAATIPPEAIPTAAPPVVEPPAGAAP